MEGVEGGQTRQLAQVGVGERVVADDKNLQRGQPTHLWG